MRREPHHVSENRHIRLKIQCQDNPECFQFQIEYANWFDETKCIAHKITIPLQWSIRSFI